MFKFKIKQKNSVKYKTSKHCDLQKIQHQKFKELNKELFYELVNIYQIIKKINYLFP